MQPAIDAIKAAGLQAYMRNPDDTWVYYTDGTRIAQIGFDRLTGWTLTTCHMPNTTTGCGFRLDSPNALDAHTLESGFMTAPAWAYARDRQTVRKWKNWEAFRSANPFNQGYAECA
jgi:hypothetical protein